MKVKSLQDHTNDYSINGRPGVALGADRAKPKGAEYEIADDDEAQMLIDDGLVEKVGAKK